MSTLIRNTELLMWFVGLACLGTYVVSKAESTRAQSTAIAVGTERGWLVSERPDMRLWSPKRIAEYEASHNEKFSPIGLLSIPTVNVRVAVFNGTSEEMLDLGAGRVAGTAQTPEQGNLAIAAHRDGFFRGLKSIAVGDTLTYESASGSITYTVSELSVVEPTDVSVLEQTDTAAITLITCYPFYFVGDAPKRFIVRAVASND